MQVTVEFADFLNGNSIAADALRSFDSLQFQLSGSWPASYHTGPDRTPSWAGVR